MSWTRPGGRAAALCTAVVLLGTLAIPAQAAPAHPNSVPGLRVPATRDLPTPGDIAAAKASESATADQVNRIDRILADASAAKEAGLAASLAANNAYADALVELQIRRDAAEVAEAKAAAADAEQTQARKLIGQLAGDLYRNGGMTPALGSLVGGNGEALQQAATLEAMAASRTRAFQSAETAAAAARSTKDAAADADRAADDAARTAESRKADAERADADRQKAVSEAAEQRTVLVGQLATLRNTLDDRGTSSSLRLIAGDLNEDPSGSAIRSAVSAGYVDTWAHLHPFDDGPTFPSDAPRARIDYILAHGEGIPARIHTVERFQVPSDHIALFTGVTL